MTPEAQRIAIAEACGWKPYSGPTKHLSKWVREQPLWEKPGVTTPEGWDIFLTCDLPWFTTDLNAMHEAEKVLKGATQHQYADWLQRCAPADGRTAFKTLRATAAQRAEAFLKTIGKWEGQP